MKTCLCSSLLPSSFTQLSGTAGKLDITVGGAGEGEGEEGKGIGEGGWALQSRPPGCIPHPWPLRVVFCSQRPHSGL